MAKKDKDRSTMDIGDYGTDDPTVAAAANADGGAAKQRRTRSPRKPKDGDLTAEDYGMIAGWAQEKFAAARRDESVDDATMEQLFAIKNKLTKLSGAGAGAAAPTPAVTPSPEPAV